MLTALAVTALLSSPSLAGTPSTEADQLFQRFVQTLGQPRTEPNWEAAAQALCLLYGPSTYPPSDPVKVVKLPTTGQVEHLWRYTDPAWAQWFTAETGQPPPQVQNRFGSGQCTSLAYAIRPDFPFDRRGGGRNDAKNWLAVAKAAGLPTSPNPSLMAIGVQDGWGSNPAGHVFICLGQTYDGRIRAIDCNFGGQPDGQVRVRVFPPDQKILGYIPAPENWCRDERFSYPLKPSQTILTVDKPFWHTPIDGQAMFGCPYPQSWWLSFKIRNLTGNDQEAKILAVSSLSESHVMRVTVERDWKWLEIGPISWGGGSASVPPHTTHSLAIFLQGEHRAIAPCEIAEPHLIMRGP